LPPGFLLAGWEKGDATMANDPQTMCDKYTLLATDMEGYRNNIKWYLSDFFVEGQYGGRFTEPADSEDLNGDYFSHYQEKAGEFNSSFEAAASKLYVEFCGQLDSWIVAARAKAAEWAAKI